MISLIMIGILTFITVSGLLHPRDWGNFNWICLLVLIGVLYLEGLGYIIVKGKEKNNGNMG